MKFKLIVCILLIIISPVNGFSDDELHNGFNFEISAGILYGNTESNFNYDDDKLINSINQDGKNREILEPYGNFKVSYKFSEVGPFVLYEYEGSHSLALGQNLGQFGDLSLALKYEEEEIWKNPYITGTNRGKTDLETISTTLQIEEFFEFINFSVTDTEYKIKDDDLGKSNSDLKREGRSTVFEIGVNIPLAPFYTIIPGFGYSKGDFDGDCYSYEGNIIKLDQMLIFSERAMTIISASFEDREYDKLHPTFNKLRKDNVYEGTIMFTLSEFMGYENLSFFTLGMCTLNESNIKFYDQNSLIIGTGISFKI
ncbi:MAG: DUF2860 domain-containing protein [Desulfobacterales bacterium]|nr:DUF2860 domain-containing protein [Desulfobacterales bacterium]